MNIETPFVVAALLALAACTNSPFTPPPATSSGVTPTVPAPGTPESEPGAASSATSATAAATTSSSASAGAGAGADTGSGAACTSAQFVACETGQACETRHGKLVHPKPCFDHAAEACAALSCAHGCDIYHGTPHQVLCAVNAASSSNMKRCAGFANWACPEKMRCVGVDPNVDDATGTCVPEP